MELAPAGVFQVLADAGDLGPLIAAHPGIAQVSPPDRPRRAQGDGSGAASLKRLVLELGGNDAALLLDDADVAVAPPIFEGRWRMRGRSAARSSGSMRPARWSGPRARRSRGWPRRW